tara:strand:- start:26045 stop:27016 length:972 start_codon:yes stop_codon:yes gene_type:complete
MIPKWLTWFAVLIVVLVTAFWFMNRTPTTSEGGATKPEAGTGAAEHGDQAGQLSDSDAGQALANDKPKVIEAVSASGVALRITRRPRVEIPEAPYGEAYEELHQNAENADAETQYKLGQILYRCRDVPVQASELKAQIDRMYQTRRSGGWEVDDPVTEEKVMRQNYENCDGVPLEAREDYRSWLQRAAESGLLEAQLNLMYHLPKGEYCQFLADCSEDQKALMDQLRKEARIHVGRAREAGSVEALRTIGGWALNEEMGTPDEVEAYAMFSAYDQIQKAAGQPGEVDAMLASVKSRLRPVDLERAEEKARELLSNPNCCVLTR